VGQDVSQRSIGQTTVREYTKTHRGVLMGYKGIYTPKIAVHCTSKGGTFFLLISVWQLKIIP